MTHDPLCLSREAPDDYWPEQLCNCRLIAKVRADELRRPSEDGWMSVRAVLAWEDQIRADERKRVANYLRDDAACPTIEATAWALAFAEAIEVMGEQPSDS